MNKKPEKIPTLIKSLSTKYENILITKPIIPIKFTIVKNHNLRLTTKNIYIEHDNKKYDLGKFEVNVPLILKYPNNSTDDANYSYFMFARTCFKSLNSNPMSPIHPHLLNRSSKPFYFEACYGNIESTLLAMFRNKDLFSALHLIHNFLQSVNDDVKSSYAYTLTKNWAPIHVNNH